MLIRLASITALTCQHTPDDPGLVDDHFISAGSNPRQYKLGKILLTLISRWAFEEDLNLSKHPRPAVIEFAKLKIQ